MRAVGRIQIYIYPCATISAVEISGYARFLCALETMAFNSWETLTHFVRVCAPVPPQCGLTGRSIGISDV